MNNERNDIFFTKLPTTKVIYVRCPSVYATATVNIPVVPFSLILLYSTYFEYSTDGVNGSEPLITFVNPVHDITLFAYQLQICHPLFSLVIPCQLRSRYDKIKAPQILHGRNTLQKYVENWELPKSTQKVLKNKEC